MDIAAGIRQSVLFYVGFSGLAGTDVEPTVKPEVLEQNFVRLKERGVLEQKMWGAPIWAVGYYAATVGDRTVSQQIRRYIQKQEHAKDQPTLL